MAQKIDFKRMYDDLGRVLEEVKGELQGASVDFTRGRKPPRIYVTVEFFDERDEVERLRASGSQAYIEEVKDIGRLTQRVGEIMRAKGLRAYPLSNPQFKSDEARVRFTNVYGFDHSLYRVSGKK